MDIPKFTPGERPSASKFNEAMEALRQSIAVVTTEGFGHTRGVEGSLTRRVDFPFVWGRLVEAKRFYDGGCYRVAYRWTQQEVQSPGAFRDMFNGYRSGPMPSAAELADPDFQVNDLAYEANGSLDPIQPGQDIVVLWPGWQHPLRTEWLFVRCQMSSFWAKLTDRSGEHYEASEVIPDSLGDTCDFGVTREEYAPRLFRFVPDTEKGELPAITQWNCQRHNSQGGNYPEIVRVWEFRFLFPGTSTEKVQCSFVQYYFDYSVGPHESDSERWDYDGTIWDRNNALDGTKGVAIRILAVVT